MKKLGVFINPNKMNRLSILFRSILLITLLAASGSFSLGFSFSPPTIAIISPGENSVVISPIDLEVEFQLANLHLVRVSLLDQTGLTLARQLLRLDQDSRQTSTINLAISFDVPFESMPALLSVEALDDDDRVINLRSIIVMLQSSGRAGIQPPSAVAPWLLLDKVEISTETNNPALSLAGTVTPLTDKPIHFEIYTTEGQFIGARQLAVEYLGEVMDFNILVPITRFDGETAFLYARQTDGRFLSNRILDSFIIDLTP